MKSLFLSFFLFAFGLSAQETHMKWSLESKKVSDCEYDLIFKVKIEKDWHIYSLIKSDGPFPTALYLTKSKDYEAVGKPKESTPHKMFDVTFEDTVRMHDNNATFTQRVKLLKSGSVKVKGKYEAQICHDELGCIFPPADDFSFDLLGTASCDKQAIAEFSVNPITTTSKDSTLAKTDSVMLNEVKQVDTVIEEAEDDTSIVGKPWWTIFLTGFIWGFAALFTPCVFPLIPMNVSFFLKRSKTPAKGRINAVLYALSIIIIFISLGLLISAIWGGGALNSFATSAGFNAVIFVLLLVFAASFLGAFEIVLPSKFVNKIDQQGDRGGFAGIFFMALALVVVSFSCTGPMIGNALVAASTSGNISGSFWAMFGFSAGLALPFGFFAFFPSFLNSMPKSGGWLNTVKVVLGFLELALALKFASNVDVAYKWGILPREVFISLWIVIFGMMTIYLFGGFKTAHDSETGHLSVTRIFFIIASFFITIYLIPGLWGAPLKIFSGVLPSYENSESPHGFMGSGSAVTHVSTGDAEYGKYIHLSKTGISYFKNDYEHALAYAKKTGKPLMIDFTGEQCANCRKTEDNIWPNSEVTKLLNNDVVLVSLYVDDKGELDPKDYQKVFWFGKEREITTVGDKFKYLQETTYGQSTQPLYVLLDHNEKPVIKPRGYNSSTEAYIKWLSDGISSFKNKKE